MGNVQFNPMRFPSYVSFKPVGAACNLTCDYCYFLEKGSMPGTTEPERRKDSKHPVRGLVHMDGSLLEKAVEQYILAQPGRNVLFTWHGGEPLLAGLDFYRHILRLQQPFRSRYHIDNVIQTNGLLLNDDWCRFFAGNHFLVGLSLDGPENLHDTFRKNSAGKGSFGKIMHGIECLQRHSVEWNVLATVNSANVDHPLEVYRFFRSRGISYLQFTPVVERRSDSDGRLLPGYEPGGSLTSESVTAVAYGNFLNTIFDEWVRHDVGSVFVNTFDATLACYLGVEPGTCVFTETCGHAAALDVNGDLYACDHFCFPEYKRGNIQTKTITKMMQAPEQRQFGMDKRDRLPPTCRQCCYLSLCHGECPRNRFLQLPGDPHPHNYLCEGLKSYFSHTESSMRFMANEWNNHRAPANIMKQL